MSELDSLAARGFLPDEALRRAALLAEARGALGARVAGSAFAMRTELLVPGRIEVLGKHTDYAGGRSLVSATEQGFAIVAAPRADGIVSITDVATAERAEFPIDPLLESGPGGWEVYPRTVARRLARDFAGPWLGLDLAFKSDLPQAAGVSSSSALVVACLLALGDRNGWTGWERYQTAIRSLEDLASYAGAVENGRPFGPFSAGTGVGTLGGNQDQTAILCSGADLLTQFGWAPVRREAASPLPASLTFVIGASGVAAEKAGAALERYNDTARRTAALWELVRPVVAPGCETLGSALDQGPEVAEVMRARVVEAAPGAERDALLARLEQLRAECGEIIPGVVAALARGNLGQVRSLVARSQAGAELALGNQVPETRALVLAALAQGAVAASAFGAGFGGSVWALVARDAAPAFMEEWRRVYSRRFPERATAARFFVTRPAPPAIELR
ncbi:MAG: galactokinase family protein [Gemmatimonadales bacterium]